MTEVEQIPTFTKLTVPLPPQFLSLAHYDRARRYIAIWFDGTKPRLADGIIAQNFPFYQAYHPFVRHAAISYQLRRMRIFLGSEEQTATHALLLDTTDNFVYAGKFEEVIDFLTNLVPRSREEIKKVDREIRKFLDKMEKATSLQDLQQIGMFQLFAPVEDRRDEVRAMEKFLDKNLPDEMRHHIRRFEDE